MALFDEKDGMLMGAAKLMANTRDAYENRLAELHVQINWMVQELDTERGRNAKLAEENRNWGEHHDDVVGRRNKMISEERAEKQNLRTQLDAKDAQIRTLQLIRAVEHAQKHANGAMVTFLLDAQSGRETRHGDVLEAYDDAYASHLRDCKMTAAHFEELRAAGHDFRPPKAADWEVDPAIQADESRSVPTPR